MIHSYELRLPFIYTDQNRILTVGGALDLMQDAADSHTISVVSPEYMAEANRIWVLNSWLVYFDSPCTFRDILTMKTWSSGFKRMFAQREFNIDNDKGETCIRARTQWFLVNSETMTPARITPADIGFYEASPAQDIEDPGRKIAIPAELTAEEAFPVRKYMLDAYHHVNNAWYVKLASEYLPDDFQIRRLRAEYKTAAHLGDVFQPQVSRQDGLVTVVLASPEGTVNAVIEFAE